MTAPLADHDRLDFVLTNQPPRDEWVIARFEELRIPAKEFGHTILDVCPDTPERAEAIRRLEEAVMWATKAIAVNQDMVEPSS